MQIRPLIYLTAVTAMLAGSVYSEDIIIEAYHDGINNNMYKDKGAWGDSHNPTRPSKSTASGCSSYEQIGSRKYQFAQIGQTLVLNKQLTARWTPVITKAGKYNVYVTWPQGANAGPVNYVVKHAGGENKIALEQNGGVEVKNADVWIPLGSYDFKAGADQYVELQVAGCRSLQRDRMGQVFADAARFSTEPVPDAATLEMAAVGRTAAALAAKAAEKAGDRADAGAPAGTQASAIPQIPAATPQPTPPPVAFSAAWLNSIPAGVSAATAANKPLLVFYYAKESNLSKHFEFQVFSDPAVKDLIQRNFVLVRVNFEDDTEAAARLGVFRGGSVLIVTANGQTLKLVKDMATPESFITRLKEIGAR